MKLSKFANLVKNGGRCAVLHVAGSGIWLSTGTAIYRATELPDMEGSEQVRTVLDMTADAWKKVYLTEDWPESVSNVLGLNLAPYAQGEQDTEKLKVAAAPNGLWCSACRCKVDGELMFYNEAYLAPLAEEIKKSEYIYYTARQTEAGQRYLVVHDGMDVLAAIMPMNILKEEYINDLADASNPMWYQGGDNKNGESKLAKQSFFHTDGTFKIAEYMHFCNRLLKKEPKEKGQAPAMIVFCAFEQMQTVIEYGKRYGFAKSYPLFFCKNYSAQVLKANMKIVGATEFAVVLYRDKLPKFRNVGEDGGKHMVFDWFRWERDSRKEYPKIHPTQKPVGVLKRLIEVFTDPGDVVIDPVAGSGTTLRAAYELGRSAYGFEVDKSFYEAAREKMLAPILMEKTTI